MKNGLYSIHVTLQDGRVGKGSGVIMFRDGKIVGGDAYLFYTGTYTVKDIDAVAAEIKAKGVEFTKEPTTIRPGVRICFIRGPQGISIELLERDQKYA